MKLKLRTQSTETLRRCFSQINTFRKLVILRFSPETLIAISADVSSVLQEPQVWCKFSMNSIFSEVEVVSVRNNVVSLEINIELFLQTLRNFDRANSRDFSIRLQRKEGASKSRTASLVVCYSEIRNSTMNHTFRIPIKILRTNVLTKEPELPRVDMMMRLPHEFSAMFKRLDKFRNNLSQEQVTIRASRQNGGTLQFFLEEADNYRVALTWKSKLEIREKNVQIEAYTGSEHGPVNNQEEEEVVEVTVRLRDWRFAQKIVGNCKSIIFLMCHNDSCLLHCALDDTDEAEVLYYVSGIRNLE